MDGGHGAVHSQFAPILGDIVDILHQFFRRAGGAALHKMPGGELGGAHPSQGTPGRRCRQQLDGSQIVALLQDPAAQPYRFLAGLQAAAGGGGFAVQGDFGSGGEPYGTPVQAGNRIPLGALREQCHLQLLYGVTVIVTDKCQIHGRLHFLHKGIILPFHSQSCRSVVAGEYFVVPIQGLQPCQGL